MARIKIIFFLLSIVSLGFFFTTSSAQKPELVFKKIDIENGLPSSIINKIYQDKDGFIWFGTSRGFCKFDGYGIKVIKQNGEEINNTINVIDLAELANGDFIIFGNEENYNWNIYHYNKKLDYITRYPIEINLNIEKGPKIFISLLMILKIYGF